jgi:hypothetical protein
VLLAHGVDEGDAVAGEPHRHPGVERPLVGADPDPREEPHVGLRVVGVEVVRLAPRGVALDLVGEVVAFVEDRHCVLLSPGRAGPVGP